jgi:oligosaccharide repeat unit polymerase
VFLSVWGITITLYNTISLGLYEVRPFTWGIISISLVTVVIGYLTVFFLYKDENFEEQKKQKSTISLQLILRVLIIVSILSFIGTLLYLYSLSAQAGSIMEFLSNPVKARMAVTLIERQSIENWNPVIAATNYLASVNIFGVLLGGYYFIFGEKMRIISVLPLINSVFFSLISFQRYFFIQIFVIWIFCIIYSLYFQNRDIRKKQGLKVLLLISASGAGILLFVVGIFLARIDYGTGEVDMIQTTSWALERVSLYLVSELVALDRYLFDTESLLYGLSIFRSFIKWLIRVGIYDVSLGLNVYYEFTNVGKLTVNTYTYIRPFYEDFGVYGLLILNFIFGAIGSFTTHNLLVKFSFVRLYLASLIFFGYFLSFFNSTFLNLTMYIFLFILIYVIERYMVAKTQ